MSEKYQSLVKVPTGINGLDDVLDGGLPLGRTSLVNGGPGCGKSIFSMEFLYRNALQDKPGIFISFEEKADHIRRNFHTLGWDLAELEQAGKLFIMNVALPPEVVIGGNFDLNSLLAIIAGKTKAMNAQLVVLDGLDVLLDIFNGEDRKRHEIHVVHQWLQAQDLTALLTTKSLKAEAVNSNPYEFLDFMVDCVIYLDQRVNEQVTTRRVRVVKYRGSGFGRNEYPYIIDPDGINVMPISTIALKHRPLGAKISTGLERLDTILDGGYRQGACTLLMGASGTGKTTIANSFAQSACQHGERVLYIQFEESAESVVTNMRSAGIELQAAMDTEQLRFLTALPEAMGSEEHLSRAIKTINDFQPKHIIIDAISAMDRVGSQQQGEDYAKRMVNFCKERGITTFFIRQSDGFLIGKQEEDITGLKFSSMVDNVIVLRYVESGGEVNRLLIVMKARGSAHSNQYREFSITDNGIDIADVYLGDEGVLTGVAQQVQVMKENVMYRRQQQLIRQKNNELAQKRATLQAQVLAMESEIQADEVALDVLESESSLLQNGRDARALMRGQDSDNQVLAQDNKGEK
ncbi:MAG: KaiC 1 [Candidatus Parabeggiatoa sp. nov. 1]|nr:MAG: KaiC 1 [Gammaproteobacteria bacterium]